MEGPEPRLGVVAFVTRSLGRIRSEFEVFLLLSLLWAVIATILGWPLLKELAKLQTVTPGDNAAVLAILGNVLPLALGLGAIALVAYSGLYVAWVRIGMIGRNHAFESGFLRRIGMVLWRTVAFFGYGILVGIGIVIVSFILSAVAGVAAGESGGTLAEALTSLILIVALVPLSLAYFFSVVGAALDRRMPIHRAFKSLQGLWRPVIGASILGYLIFTLPSIVTSLSSGAAVGEPNLLWTSVSNLLGALANLYLITVAMTAWQEAERRGKIDEGD